jgi:hypothetical protein
MEVHCAVLPCLCSGLKFVTLLFLLKVRQITHFCGRGPARWDSHSLWELKLSTAQFRTPLGNFEQESWSMVSLGNRVDGFTILSVTGTGKEPSPKWAFDICLIYPSKASWTWRWWTHGLGDGKVIIRTCRRFTVQSKKGRRCLPYVTVPYDIFGHVCIETSPCLIRARMCSPSPWLRMIYDKCMFAMSSRELAKPDTWTTGGVFGATPTHTFTVVRFLFWLFLKPEEVRSQKVYVHVHVHQSKPIGCSEEWNVRISLWRNEKYLWMMRLLFVLWSQLMLHHQLCWSWWSEDWGCSVESL